MSFLSSFFLMALPAIALPVIVHLLARKRRKVIPWGAMQFLAKANPRARRSWRLKDMLLLLLRMLVLACFIIALARPLVPATWLGGHDTRDLILVVDQSMSTQWDFGQETAYERQLGLIEEALEDYEGSDFIRCVIAGEQPQWVTSYALKADGAAKEGLLKQLEEFKPGLGSADILASVEEAWAAEAAHPQAARHVILVTDGQAKGWKQEQTGRWQAIASQVAESPEGSVLRTLSVPRAAEESLGNLAVTGLTPNREVIALGEPVEITASVQNFSVEASPSSVLRWSKGEGESLGLATVPALAPGASTTVKLEHPLTDLGVHELTATLESGDGLDADNQGSTRVEVAEGIPVLIVDQSESARFLQAALGAFGQETGSVFRGKQVSSSALEEEKLSNYQAVILTDLSALSETSVMELQAYVRRGGGLWMAPAPETSVALFNERFASDAAPLAPARLGSITGDANQTEKFEVVSPPTQAHPATVVMADTERLDLDDVRIYRRYLYQTPLPNDLSVLLRGGQGHPLVVEQGLGKGRVVLQAFPLDRSWSNLPSMQVYVAMVYEWLWYLVEPSRSGLNLTSGEPYEYVLPEKPEVEQASVTLPDGESRPLTIESTVDGERLVRFEKTRIPGPYQLELTKDGKTVLEQGFRVERNRGESDLSLLDEATTETLRMEADMLFGDEKAGERSSKAEATARREEPIWFWLLLGVILFLVCESALACWIAKSRTLTTPGARLSKAR